MCSRTGNRRTSVYARRTVLLATRRAKLWRAADARDVRDAIRFTTARGVQVRAHSGGHSYAGYSTMSDGVALDLRRLNLIRVDKSNGTAIVGAGSQLIDISSTLADEAIAAWQAWAPHAPDAVTSILHLNSGVAPSVAANGQFMAPRGPILLEMVGSRRTTDRTFGALKQREFASISTTTSTFRRRLAASGPGLESRGRRDGDRAPRLIWRRARLTGRRACRVPSASLCVSWPPARARAWRRRRVASATR